MTPTTEQSKAITFHKKLCSFQRNSIGFHNIKQAFALVGAGRTKPSMSTRQHIKVNFMKSETCIQVVFVVVGIGVPNGGTGSI